ncbi:sulfurtransferase TusA family protein [Paenibacillus sp. sgz302251]|uniref:sulfurtransferase TusA family protein n=1 Tax=Paenibacillus sp. sgz302251 TaxID=3414493 RepID=UPI003C7A03C2
MSTPSVIKADLTLDCKGLACPMPIVKTKKTIEQLSSGQVMEVQATDKGSLADIQGWAKNTGHHYLGTIHEGDVLKHFLRKASPSDAKEEIKFPHTLTNAELEQKLDAGEPIIVLDVREPAEFAFNHIPGSLSIPLGDLEERLAELQADRAVHVVCRTGTRSDLACQLLADKGFKQVQNVVPGMSAWNGATEQSI